MSFSSELTTESAQEDGRYLRGRLDGRVHRHAGRLHGLVPGQEDQDGVRHEHHGPSTRARSCGMIGGDGINDESNKTAPPPSTFNKQNSNAIATGSQSQHYCLNTRAAHHNGTTPQAKVGASFGTALPAFRKTGAKGMTTTKLLSIQSPNPRASKTQ